MRSEEANERVGLCTAGLWPAFLNLRAIESEGQVNDAGRRPAVRTATAKRAQSRASQASGVVLWCLVAQAFLPVPQDATCAASKNKKTKNAFFDLACLARLVLRCYVGTGRNACATERQKLDDVLIFSYDATLRNALDTTITRAESFCTAAAGAVGADFTRGAFCCACRRAGWAAA
jgi:hypothetical protein